MMAGTECAMTVLRASEERVRGTAGEVLPEGSEATDRVRATLQSVYVCMCVCVCVTGCGKASTDGVAYNTRMWLRSRRKGAYNAASCERR